MSFFEDLSISSSIISTPTTLSTTDLKTSTSSLPLTFHFLSEKEHESKSSIVFVNQRNLFRFNFFSSDIYCNSSFSEKRQTMPGIERFAKRPPPKSDGNAPPPSDVSKLNPKKGKGLNVKFTEGTEFVERPGNASMKTKPMAPVPSFGLNMGGFGGSSLGGSGGFGFGTSSSFGSSFQPSNTVRHLRERLLLFHVGISLLVSS